MVSISDPEDEGSHPQPSSSKSKIANDNKNPLADFKFDKLPTELLVEIFRHARADSVYDAQRERHCYPVALSHVCCHWRTVAIGAPTLWANIRILEYYTEKVKEAARIYLERSKTCPIFLTWFTGPGLFHNGVPGVIENLIIPAAERWQRITLIAGNKTVPDALLAAMEPLDFPVLRDIEVSCVPFAGPFSPTSTLCRSAPLLRRCRFHSVASLPPLPSNLVVLDCVFLSLGGSTEFDLDPFLEFLPHVAHSLEHLRFGPPPTSVVHSTPRISKIPLENLKSLLITDSHVVVDHILAPNLTYFVVVYPPNTEARGAAEIFQGFSAPKLQSIQFHRTPLLPLLTLHNLPSMFPLLESVLLSGCADESAFIPLLEPPEPNKPVSLKKASKYPQNHRKVENPFPHLKELTVSDMTNWTSLQAAIEKRVKNGDKSLRKVQLPKGEATKTIMPHLRRWLPAQGIELVLYEPGELPRSTPEFQDKFCDDEDGLFQEISGEGSEWDDDDDEDDEDDDYDYWMDRPMSSPDDEPWYMDPRLNWDGLHDDYDDEEEEYEEDDFYEG